MSSSLFRKWLGIELVEVTSREKLISTLGGALSMLFLIGLTFWLLPNGGATSVVASMGASAVLLFAVPHGQLSQPWPVIAGHGISALIGVICAHYIPNPTLAAACAVGLAIGAMLQLKCVHPPGGATAFTAVMGGAAIRRLGFHFVLFPVVANALVMVVIAIVINSFFKWRRYPAILNRPAQKTTGSLLNASSSPTHEEVLAAVKSLNSFVDITEEDLLRLTELLSRRNDKNVHPRQYVGAATPSIRRDNSQQDNSIARN